MTPTGEARMIELLERIVAALERDRAPPAALMDADELSRLLGVDVRTLRRMRHQEAVPKPIQIGNAIRWRTADVDRFLLGRKP